MNNLQRAVKVLERAGFSVSVVNTDTGRRLIAVRVHHLAAPDCIYRVESRVEGPVTDRSFVLHGRVERGAKKAVFSECDCCASLENWVR